MNKYLVVSPYPPPFFGGHIVYISTIVEHCSERFDILTNELPAGHREIITAKDRPFRKRWIRNMFKQPRFLEQLITYLYIVSWISLKNIPHKYEAILVNWAPAPNSLVHILGRLIGVPTIGFLHGEEITLTLRGKGPKSALKRLLMKYGYKKADGFVASSHFIRDQAIELGIAPALIDVIPVCFNPRNVTPSGVKTRTGHTIITVGSAVERKGFHFLVDAVHALRKEFPHIRLHIVGDGPFLAVVRGRIAQYDLGDCVVLHGNLFEEKLSQLFDESDLFVLANTMLDDGNTEGAPLVVCDASSHGLPVIGGTGGGLATTITEGKTGFIVDAGNVQELAAKIRFLFTHPDIAAEMGRAGIEKVRRDHDPEKAGKLFGDSLNRLSRLHSAGPHRT